MAVAGSCVLAAAIVVGAGFLYLSNVSMDPDELLSASRGSEPARTLAIGERTAAMLETAYPQSSRPYSPDIRGDVLVAIDTTKGEVVLLGVELPDGKRCVVQRYTRSETAGGGGGGRCAMSNEELFQGTVDVSASEELNPKGPNISVVWGVAPASAERVELRGQAGIVRNAPAVAAAGSWEGLRFFMVESPVIAAEVVTAIGPDGKERGTSRKPFRAR
jgi:hypothetical protein